MCTSVCERFYGVHIFVHIGEFNFVGDRGKVLESFEILGSMHIANSFPV